MTREEWYWAYHEIRLWKRENRPPFVLKSGVIVSALKSLYRYSYTESENAFIRLTRRYRDKMTREGLISRLNRIRTWRKPARERAKGFMRQLIYSNNPFLAMLPKSGSGFGGAYIPVPTLASLDTDDAV